MALCPGRMKVPVLGIETSGGKIRPKKGGQGRWRHLSGILYKTLFSINKVIQNSRVKVAQLFPTLCYPMEYTVHGILQARILEYVAVPFSRGSSQPRDQTQVSRIAGRFVTS